MMARGKALLAGTATTVFIMLNFNLSVLAQSEEETDVRMGELFGQHEIYHAFFTSLKKAVAAGDRRAVAAMVDFPIVVSIGGKDVRINSGKDLVAHYDHVFTNEIVTVVEKQTYADLFTNYQGIMIGDGEIWFSGICIDHDCKKVTVKITTINTDV